MKCLNLFEHFHDVTHTHTRIYAISMKEKERNIIISKEHQQTDLDICFVSANDACESSNLNINNASKSRIFDICEYEGYAHLCDFQLNFRQRNVNYAFYNIS